MTRHDEMLLKNAVQAVRATGPNDTELAASAQRVAGRLGLDGAADLYLDAIESCGDVRQLLPAFRTGYLSNVRTVLVEAHLRECGACHRYFRGGSESALVDWSTPALTPVSTRAFVWRPRVFAWALAPCLVVLASALFFYQAYWQVPPGVRAEVQSIDGSAYRISNQGDRKLVPGDSLQEGDHLRTGGGAHAVLRLSDGSTVEVNERSVLNVGARGHNMTLTLDNGAVIVQAAQRTSGHLYVKTPDCRVAVTGTVFSVNSGIKGSRVAVLQGTVHVTHDGVDTLMHPGDQVATSDSLRPMQVEQQIAWSHDRDKFLPLLAQFAVLQHRIEQIPFPQARYTSDLLSRMPADTLMYVSIPNLGDFLSEANGIFHDQMKQSPALQQWWGRGNERNSADLDALVDKLHQMSQYLGDEVVIVGVDQEDHPGFAVVADVKKSGLGDFLKTQLPFSTQTHGLIVIDEASLQSMPVSSNANSGVLALVRENEVVFSNSVATLKQMNAKLNATASGFAATGFGQQISAAYSRGAGIILAADLHQMMGDKLKAIRTNSSAKSAVEQSGFEGVQYLIAEHRETNGTPENHLNLQFSGTRQRVASWLAAPAPIGSLEFVTPNASIVVAGLSKDPKAIADDLLAMTIKDDGEKTRDMDAIEQKLHISLRDDVAANLGGDFLVSLDGPVLPTPAWKAVIEVHDSARLEQTLEQLIRSVNEQPHGKDMHTIVIEHSEVGGQSFYSVHDKTSGSTLAQYTFADGYMIVAPTRALLIDALHAHDNGDSLARSSAFKALLPKDENENYSAVAYQNLGPVLTPLLSQMSGEQAQAIRQLAADARPTAICAWGKDSRIEAASDSRLFGFDFLALGSLIGAENKSGNKHGDGNVKE